MSTTATASSRPSLNDDSGSVSPASTSSPALLSPNSTHSFSSAASTASAPAAPAAGAVGLGHPSSSASSADGAASLSRNISVSSASSSSSVEAVPFRNPVRQPFGSWSRLAASLPGLHGGRRTIAAANGRDAPRAQTAASLVDPRSARQGRPATIKSDPVTALQGRWTDSFAPPPLPTPGDHDAALPAVFAAEDGGSAVASQEEESEDDRYSSKPPPPPPPRQRRKLSVKSLRQLQAHSVAARPCPSPTAETEPPTSPAPTFSSSGSTVRGPPTLGSVAVAQAAAAGIVADADLPAPPPPKRGTDLDARRHTGVNPVLAAIAGQHARTMPCATPSANANANAPISTPSSTRSSLTGQTAPAIPQQSRLARGPKDFEFGETLGEGSYSTVMEAFDLVARPTMNPSDPSAPPTRRAYAIKVLDKVHILKEKKQKYVNVEKTALSLLNRHPGIIRLYWTFQDHDSLYFVLELARNGELLGCIKKMRVKVTDFGSAKILKSANVSLPGSGAATPMPGPTVPATGPMASASGPSSTLTAALQRSLPNDETRPPAPAAAAAVAEEPERANSFVGTAEYVSPELLTEKSACKASDWWAFGCVLYQMLAGRPPFKGPNEYQTFQRIIKLDYTFPDGFPPEARDLIQRLLVLNPAERLGAGPDGAAAIRAHPFFADVDWNELWKMPPVPIRTGIYERPNPPPGAASVGGVVDSFEAWTADLVSEEGSEGLEEEEGSEGLLLEEEEEEEEEHGFYAQKAGS